MAITRSEWAGMRLSDSHQLIIAMPGSIISEVFSFVVPAWEVSLEWADESASSDE